jgi:hypothetical protein
VRQGNLCLFPQQLLSLALVLLVGVRLHDGDHAAIGFRDDILVTTRRFGKNSRRPSGFKHSLGMSQHDPLDRALSDREAVVLLQLAPRLGERLIGGKIGDGALQG